MEWDWTTVSVDWYLVTVSSYCCAARTLSLCCFTYMSACCPQKNTPPPTPSSNIEQKQTEEKYPAVWSDSEDILCGQGWSEALVQSSVGLLRYASAPDVPPPAESKPKTRLSQGFQDIYLPVTLNCSQEFVVVMFHSYCALTDRHCTNSPTSELNVLQHKTHPSRANWTLISTE